MEPIYGSRGTATLVLATAPVVALAYTVTAFVAFVLNVEMSNLGEEGVATFFPLAAALLVAVKHIMPEAPLLGSQVKAKVGGQEYAGGARNIMTLDNCCCLLGVDL